MSEKTLMELVETQLDIEGIRLQDREDGPWNRMLEARIRRAEAAEKAMESWLAWCDSGNVDGTWDAFVGHVAEYKSAREAVRKLEEAT